ncbi:MAG: NlpC/P60 family protein [Minicystis sp.]
MSWNSQAAIHYLDWHASGHSIGRCAQYTREAIEHGGIHLERHASAKDYGRSLLNAGFVEVHETHDYRAGDVVVIQPIPGHPHGHMAMYDGHQWVSDFKQRTLYPGGSYRSYAPSYTVYRHP